MELTGEKRPTMFGCNLPFEEFKKLLKKDIKPKTMSLVQEIYYDTVDLLSKNKTNEANDSWARLLELDIFEIDKSNEKVKVCNKSSKTTTNTNKNSYSNNVVAFKKNIPIKKQQEALEWLQISEKLLDEGNFDEAFEAWNNVLDMDVLEFSYAKAYAIKKKINA